MTRGRTAPGFQIYASDLLADRRFRLASLAERGLLLTLLCECWTNGSVPADGASLARYLGVDLDALKVALTDRVLDFFEGRETENGCEIFSPELEVYRRRVEAIRAAQSRGGKRSTSRHLTDKRKRSKASVGAGSSGASDSQVPEPGPEPGPEPELERSSKALSESHQAVDEAATAYRTAKGRA